MKQLYALPLVVLLNLLASCSLVTEPIETDSECIFSPISHVLWDDTVVESSSDENLRILRSGYSVSSDGCHEKLFMTSIGTTDDFYFESWMLPADGAVYSVSINGELVQGLLVPEQNQGWQLVPLVNSKGERLLLHLNSGINEVAIKSSHPELPQIENIFVSSSADLHLDHNAYDNQMANLFDNRLELLSDVAQDNCSIVHMSGSSRLSMASIIYSPIEYRYYDDVQVTYTATKEILLTQSSTVKIVSSAPSQWLTARVIELFSDDCSVSYSTNCSSVNGVLNEVVPAGHYIVRVRANDMRYPGKTYLSIQTGNTTNNYGLMPVTDFCIPASSSSASSFESFTCDSYCQCPIITVSQGASNPIHVIGYSNSCKIGTFNWQFDPRISFVTSDRTEIHVSDKYTILPTSSKTDVYAWLAQDKTNKNLVLSFATNLDPEDMIQSGSKTHAYNCFSWTGDIYDEWIVPHATGSEFLLPGYSSLDAFDLFYSLCGYKRNDSDNSKGCIGLYYGNYGFTHAAITNNGISIYPHGYDWESKCGPQIRIMHPSGSMDNTSYGTILYYYSPDPQINSSSQLLRNVPREDWNVLIETYFST